MTSSTHPAPVSPPQDHPRQDRQDTVRRPPALAGIVQRTLRDSAFAITAFPIGLAAFVVVVVGISLGASLAILWVGIPVLLATVGAARGFAALERVRLARWQGIEMHPAAYRAPAPGASRTARILAPLRDPQSLLDCVWAVVSLATGIVAFSVTLTWLASVGAGLTYWFWERWLPDSDGTLTALLGMGDSRAAETAFNTVLGVVALVTLPAVARLSAALHATVAVALLDTRGELQAEVRQAWGASDATQAAEADALRRLERDIHDGPQQRLIRLQMDLGRVGTSIEADPAKAREILREAQGRTQEAVEELRALSRGIAPPLLADRGLEVALREMVAGHPVPVDLQVSLAAPLPTGVETAVYFVVSESLTNIAKHAHAERAEVSVVSSPEEVAVTVTDDGRGGAHQAKGRGLAGLTTRLAGVGGVLTVESPEGGPTAVRAVVALRR